MPGSPLHQSTEIKLDASFASSSAASPSRAAVNLDASFASSAGSGATFAPRLFPRRAPPKRPTPYDAWEGPMVLAGRGLLAQLQVYEASIGRSAGRRSSRKPAEHMRTTTSARAARVLPTPPAKAHRQRSRTGPVRFPLRAAADPLKVRSWQTRAGALPSKTRPEFYALREPLGAPIEVARARAAGRRLFASPPAMGAVGDAALRLQMPPFSGGWRRQRRRAGSKRATAPGRRTSGGKDRCARCRAAS